jgi:hypothetical protein
MHYFPEEEGARPNSRYPTEGDRHGEHNGSDHGDNAPGHQN